MDRTTTREAVVVRSYLGPGDERSLADDVLDGMTRPFKEIQPKHFYDARGGDLFDRITELDEYYPTRAERTILETRGAEAIDVTGGLVRSTAEELVDELPGLSVHGIVGDFERHLRHVPAPLDGPRVVAFLGGTIGNFPPGSRRRFLRGLARLLRPGTADRLLLGTDLVKDVETLEAAYNDSQGITAEFNRNVLRVMNRELDADFEVDAFEHVAFFDHDREWIEMRLRAQRRMDVHVGDLDLDLAFAAREEMRTEISAKFTRERLQGDLAAAGMRPVEVMTDPDGLFALSLSERAGG